MARRSGADAETPWSDATTDSERGGSSRQGGSSARGSSASGGADRSAGGKEWESLAPAVGDTGVMPTVRDGSGRADSEGGVRRDRRADSDEGRRSDRREGAEREAARTSPARTKATKRASAREQAVLDRPKALKLRQAVIVLAVPLSVLMVAIRLVATPAFMWLVYHWPGFPEDRFGFSMDDRMTFGSYGLDYILNFAPERYLADLTTVDGSTIFTSAEVSHMTDVKHVIIGAMVLVGLLALVAWICSWGLPRRAPGAVSRALFVGAWATVVLMVVLGALASLGWESFFITFHKIFFSGGNWAFRVSDSLIRLYPDEYWVLSALGIVVLAVVLVVLLLALTWPTSGRRARRERAVTDRQRTATRLRG